MRALLGFCIKKEANCARRKSRETVECYKCALPDQFRRICYFETTTTTTVVGELEEGSLQSIWGLGDEDDE